MRKNLSKGIVTFYLLITNLILNAQTGPSSQDDVSVGNLEGTNDPSPASIDSNLYLLIIIGIVTAFYIIDNNRRKSLRNN